MNDDDSTIGHDEDRDELLALIEEQERDRQQDLEEIPWWAQCDFDELGRAQVRMNPIDGEDRS